MRTLTRGNLGAFYMYVFNITPQIKLCPKISSKEYTQFLILKCVCCLWGIWPEIVFQSDQRFVIVFRVFSEQRLHLTLFEAPLLPALMPSICLRLPALMNAAGRPEGRHDGLKEVILDSKQMTCLILGICIVLLRARRGVTRCFLTMHRSCPHSSWHRPDTYGIETCLRLDFQGYSTV